MCGILTSRTFSLQRLGHAVLWSGTFLVPVSSLGRMPLLTPPVIYGDNGYQTHVYWMKIHWLMVAFVPWVKWRKLWQMYMLKMLLILPLHSVPAWRIPFLLWLVKCLILHMHILHCVLASCGAVYCNRSCLWVCGCVCLWVCYHDNSKLRALILTKLGLWVKVVTISS